MVKGISRRVVVVKAPVGSIFDEAIFIIKDGISSEVDSEAVLREACFAADEYVKLNCNQKRKSFKMTPVFLIIVLAILALIVVLSTNNYILN